MSYIKPRNIFATILISFITCGIYGLILFFTYSDELIRETKRHNINVTLVQPIEAFVLTLITCGIYGVYYCYKQAKAIYQLSIKYNILTVDPVLVLLFQLFINSSGLFINIYTSSILSEQISTKKLYQHE